MRGTKLKNSVHAVCTRHVQTTLTIGGGGGPKFCPRGLYTPPCLEKWLWKGVKNLNTTLMEFWYYLSTYILHMYYNRVIKVKVRKSASSGDNFYLLFSCLVHTGVDGAKCMVQMFVWGQKKKINHLPPTRARQPSWGFLNHLLTAPSNSVISRGLFTKPYRQQHRGEIKSIKYEKIEDVRATKPNNF